MDCIAITITEPLAYGIQEIFQRNLRAVLDTKSHIRDKWKQLEISSVHLHVGEKGGQFHLDATFKTLEKSLKWHKLVGLWRETLQAMTSDSMRWNLDNTAAPERDRYIGFNPGDHSREPVRRSKTKGDIDIRLPLNIVGGPPVT